MQGGRRDNSVLGSWFGETDNESGSGYESEVEVRSTSVIRLGHRLDGALQQLRTWFAVSISLPIAWLCLHPSIGSFRLRKKLRVREGTDTVVRLQAALRCRVLDVYFQVVSFCAEEEFYLLVLPFLIWNVDRVLGRRLTLIVCFGLLAGNTMKDVFQLPRPRSPPVWRPRHQEAVDSTSLQDFGFPSTHAMNAVSNSLFVCLYLSAAATAGGSPAALDPWTLLESASAKRMYAAAAAYIFSLCLSRLYLGAHTPTDLRGGVALGGVVVAVYFAVSERLDAALFAAADLPLKLVVSSVLFLLLNPQPRPGTPTFAQNALLTGLVLGCVMGSRHYNDLGSSGSSSGSSGAADGADVLAGLLAGTGAWLNPVRAFSAGLSAGEALAVRTVVGYAVVLLLRVLVKTTVVSALSVVGIATAPKLEAPVTETEEDIDDDGDGDRDGAPEQESKGKSVRRSPGGGRRRVRHVLLFTRDIDIVGTAVVKVSVYAALAWAITFLVPVIHCAIGLAQYEPYPTQHRNA